MNDEEWLKNFVNEEGSTETRLIPNEKNITGLTAVLCAVRVISETISSLKCKVQRLRKSGVKEEITDHPVYRMLNWSHDGGDTIPQILIESLINNACLNGNGLAEIVRDGRLRATELYCLESQNMEYKYTDKRKKSYIYRNNTTSTDKKQKDITYPSRSVLHIPYFVTDGWIGKSPITLFRETLSMSLAVQVYGVQFFRSGGVLSGFLTKEGIIGKKDREVIQKDWKEMRSPIDNWHNPPVLHGGLRFEKIGISPEDCEFIVNRNLQVLEASRMYKVPPHLLGVLEGMNYNNIEMQMINFITYTILRWVCLLENEINLKCFTRDESYTYKVEIGFENLLRGDNESRYAAIERQVKSGVLTPDEGRSIEGRNPYPDGIGSKPLVMASQLDTLERVINGLSKLNTSKNNDDKNNDSNKDKTNNDKSNNIDNKTNPSTLQDYMTIFISSLSEDIRTNLLNKLNESRK